MREAFVSTPARACSSHTPRPLESVSEATRRDRARARWIRHRMGGINRMALRTCVGMSCSIRSRAPSQRSSEPGYWAACSPLSPPHLPLFPSPADPRAAPSASFACPTTIRPILLLVPDEELPLGLYNLLLSRFPTFGPPQFLPCRVLPDLFRERAPGLRAPGSRAPGSL